MSKPITSSQIPLKDLFANIESEAHKIGLNIGIESTEHLPKEQIFTIIEQTADEETKLRLRKSAELIIQKLAEFREYETKHISKEIGKFENYLQRSIEKLFNATNEFVFSLQDGKLQPYFPSWNIPMQGVQLNRDVVAQGTYKFTTPGKTTGEIFIQKGEWIQKKLPSDCGFIMGIVNCETIDESDSTVSFETLEQASTDDLEVFDTIHELERIYKSETQNIGLSTIKINRDNLTIESDNRTAERLISYVEEERKSGKEISSLSLFIVSESYNLSNRPLTSIAEIYSRIPFGQLKEIGIEDVMIDFVSCNTAEIASDIMELTAQHASDNQLKISSIFHNGYIFNNITYCYLGKTEYQELLRSNATPQEFYDSPDNSPKSKKLIQVITPGLSNIFTSTISQFTTSREVSNKSKKCLIPTKIPHIKHGSSFIYCADERLRSIEVGDAATENTAELEHKITKQSVAKSVAAFHEKLAAINQQAFSESNPSNNPTTTSFHQKMVGSTSLGNKEI